MADHTRDPGKPKKMYEYKLEQHIVRQLEELHPHADQRQVEDQQHHVADIHAGDDAPEQLRVLSGFRPRAVWPYGGINPPL
jgi:hypothetical protein